MPVLVFQSSSGRNGVARRAVLWTLAASAILLFLIAPSVFAADSFDLQAAINACPAGGTVTIPAGTFTITSTVNLKSDVIIQGSGDASIINSGVPAGYSALRVMSVSNVTLRDFKITGSGYNAFVGSGCANLTLDHLTINGDFNRTVKIGGDGVASTNLVISGCVCKALTP